MKRFLASLGRFFKKFIPVWIVLGVCAIFLAVDGINASGYKISMVKAFSEDNPEGDPTKLYFATPEKEEVIQIQLQITAFGKPKANHSIVGIEKACGAIKESRKKTDENGYCTFNFSSYPVYREEINEEVASVLFYEEDSAFIIEIQVKTIINFTLYRRNNG